MSQTIKVLIKSTLVSSIVFAQTVLASTSQSSVCSVIQKSVDVMNCLRTKQAAFSAAKELRSAESDARKGGTRWLNPEIQTQGAAGKALGNEIYQFQGSLLQSIQTGGKRGAQVLSGESNALMMQVKSRTEQGEMLKSTALGMYRFKQITNEIDAIQEAADTFKKLVHQYQSRTRLSPEQEVSLSIFKLAQGDYELRLIEKKNESLEVKNYFQATLDLDIEQLEKILPIYQEPTSKELDSFASLDLVKSSPEVLTSKSDFHRAEALALQARGDAYSDITFGPMVAVNRDGPFQENLFGAMINIPFPIWNQNGHQVAAAQKEADLLEQKLKIKEISVELEIKRMRTVILSAKTKLASLPSQNTLNQKHEQVERQFFRGLVSPAIMIEAHRALVDFLIQRHQSENFVMKNLWDLYMISDRLEEKLL